MEWLFLESLLALVIAGFIVWWTMRAPRRRDATREGAKGVAADDGPDA
jgi:hypothetical protein